MPKDFLKNNDKMIITMGILKKLQIGMMFFGFAMGLIFPVYASFFVQFKSGMQIWFVMGCLIAGLVVGGFSYFLVNKILIKELMKIAIVSKEVSSGNMDTSVDINSPDAIGDISRGFNIMIQDLRDLILLLKKDTRKLNEIASELSFLNSELVKTADEQKVHVAQISSATHEASVTISDISENLASTVSFSLDINKNAENASRSISNSMETMNMTVESMSRTASQMEILSEQSGRISSILRIIDDIAEQTNLLALNAAIEAARAGEQGRGFAIVADEVRKLAERTTRSTKEIGNMVNTFQAGVNEVTDSVKEHSRLLGSLKETFLQSSESVNKIIKHIEKISGMIQNISNAVNEQTDANTSINESMEKINSAFSYILDSTRKVATEGDEITEISSNLVSVLEKISHEKQTFPSEI